MVQHIQTNKHINTSPEFRTDLSKILKAKLTKPTANMTLNKETANISFKIANYKKCLLSLLVFNTALEGLRMSARKKKLGYLYWKRRR